MYSIKSNNFKESISTDKYILTPISLENNIIIINCFCKGTINFRIKQKDINSIVVKTNDSTKTLYLLQKMDLKFVVMENDIIEFYIKLNNLTAKIELFKFDYKTNNKIIKKLPEENKKKFKIVTTKLIESIALSIKKININKKYF